MNRQFGDGPYWLKITSNGNSVRVSIDGPDGDGHFILLDAVKVSILIDALQEELLLMRNPPKEPTP